MELSLRKAIASDAGPVWAILQQAISRRREEGSQQWQDGYPNPEIVRQDIQNGHGYVLEEQGEMKAYAALIFNYEPAYDTINGAWLNDAEFLVVHRVAVAEGATGRGLAQQMFLSFEQLSEENGIFNIKVDTNFDNLPMLKILDNLGYTYCGEVYMGGGLRKAFQKVLGEP